MIEYLVVTFGPDFMWTPITFFSTSEAFKLVASDKEKAPECVSRLFVVGRQLL